MYKPNLDQLTTQTLQELQAIKKTILDPPHLVVSSVIHSLLPMVVALSGADHDLLTASVTSICRDLFEGEAEANRPYARDRFNLDTEQAGRLKAVIVRSVLEIAQMPARRKGKDFLVFLVPGQRDDLRWANDLGNQLRTLLWQGILHISYFVYDCSALLYTWTFNSCFFYV